MNRTYKQNIDEIVSKIKEIDDDVIIVGDNSSGKSDILYQILKEKENYIRNDYTDIYYIDSNNRTFNYKNVNKNISLNHSPASVLGFRINELNFNLKDTFSTSFIENIYGNYESSLKNLLKEFLNIEFEIIENNNNYAGAMQRNIKLNNIIYDKLSSGYQAIIRLFLEILYATTYKTINTILIDEINEFLSAKNEANIYSFLKTKYPEKRFIMITHSADVISNAGNAKIITIKDNNYNILDGKDFNTNTDVRRIFKNLYFLNKETEVKDNINFILRKLLEARLNNSWTESLQKELEELDESKMSSLQKNQLKQIREWW